MKRSPARILAAVCLLSLGAGIFVLIAASNNAGQRDFISYWAAGKQLIHGADPYDAAAVAALERTAGYQLDYRLIMRNPPYALFLALPLGLFSANAGLILWLTLLLASMVLSVRMIWLLHGRPPDRLHLMGYCFAPVMECLMAGQFGLFLLLGVVLFLFFHRSRPALAGAALLLCAVKPHLFVPFGIVLLAWIVLRREFRILAGFFIALGASCALTLALDRQIFAQYAGMIHSSAIMREIVPTLSEMLRVVVDRDAAWLQFLPEAGGCAWAMGYFWTRRRVWDWNRHGLLLLVVSVLCSPYALFPDEAMLLPAVLAGVYRAERTGRSLLPFGVFAAVALVEVFANVPMTTLYYLWTVPAWLGWYLYATANLRDRSDLAASI